MESTQGKPSAQFLWIRVDSTAIIDVSGNRIVVSNLKTPTRITSCQPIQYDDTENKGHLDSGAITNQGSSAVWAKVQNVVSKYAPYQAQPSVSSVTRETGSSAVVSTSSTALRIMAPPKRNSATPLLAITDSSDRSTPSGKGAAKEPATSASKTPSSTTTLVPDLEQALTPDTRLRVRVSPQFDSSGFNYSNTSLSAQKNITRKRRAESLKVEPPILRPRHQTRKECNVANDERKPSAFKVHLLADLCRKHGHQRCYFPKNVTK